LAGWLDHRADFAGYQVWLFDGDHMAAGRCYPEPGLGGPGRKVTLVSLPRQLGLVTIGLVQAEYAGNPVRPAMSDHRQRQVGESGELADDLIGMAGALSIVRGEFR
jgi:hypothetical protein